MKSSRSDFMPAAKLIRLSPSKVICSEVDPRPPLFTVRRIAETLRQLKRRRQPMGPTPVKTAPSSPSTVTVTLPQTDMTAMLPKSSVPRIKGIPNNDSLRTKWCLANWVPYIPPSEPPDQTHMNGTRKKAAYERVVEPTSKVRGPVSIYQAPPGGVEGRKSGSLVSSIKSA